MYAIFELATCKDLSSLELKFYICLMILGQIIQELNDT